MKRTTYKGYIIDHDDLGRTYIYNTASQYSEDSDRQLVTDYHGKSEQRLTDLQAGKLAVDTDIEQRFRETITRQVGQNLKAARSSANMTQVELAKKIGTTQAQIARYETGEQDMTITRMREIEIALGAKFGTLIKGI